MQTFHPNISNAMTAAFGQQVVANNQVQHVGNDLTAIQAQMQGGTLPFPCLFQALSPLSSQAYPLVSNATITSPVPVMPTTVTATTDMSRSALAFGSSVYPNASYSHYHRYDLAHSMTPSIRTCRDTASPLVSSNTNVLPILASGLPSMCTLTDNSEASRVYSANGIHGIVLSTYFSPVAVSPNIVTQTTLTSRSASSSIPPSSSSPLEPMYLLQASPFADQSKQERISKGDNGVTMSLGLSGLGGLPPSPHELTIPGNHRMISIYPIVVPSTATTATTTASMHKYQPSVSHWSGDNRNEKSTHCATGSLRSGDDKTRHSSKHQFVNVHTHIEIAESIDGVRRVPVLAKAPRSDRVNICANAKRKRTDFLPYLVRARRLLRFQEECVVCGIGQAVAAVSEVVEQLKREKVAIVTKIVTDLVEVNDRANEYLPVLEVRLRRGEHGHLLSDFRRRKVIEVFELFDTDLKGELTIPVIEKMDLPGKFHANANSQKQAQDLIKGKETLNLSEFISYCSLLVHPLLLEFHFKRAISSLNGKVDVHYGPLPALHSECQEFVLVSENFGDEKASSQKEPLHGSERSSEYDYNHECEDDDVYESECDNVDKDEEDESDKETNENGAVFTSESVRSVSKNEQVISCPAVPGMHQNKQKAVGVWKPKAPVSPMYKN